ncbi:hypothetical protein LINGRAHAP2_LOCUS3541 [Linum grandiflorum]
MEIAKPPDIRIGSLLDEITLISSDLTALCVPVENLDIPLFGHIEGLGPSNFPDANKLNFISDDDKLVGLGIVWPTERGYQELLKSTSSSNTFSSSSFAVKWGGIGWRC